MNRLICFLLFILSFVFSQQAYATHNRAGEITYVQTGDLSIFAKVTTYTKASSDQADRDSLTIDWGDGTFSRAPRTNGAGQGVVIANDIKVNVYELEHNYPGRSTYTISIEDPNRVGGIRNIDFPNSIAVKFYVETTLTLFNPQFQGLNNSAILLQEPVDEACVGKRFIHNPGAFDADGDSLAYELIIPLQAKGELVPDYEFPDMVIPGALNQINFNPKTGDFIWNAPQLAGEYNIAIKIKEYRNGFLINAITRDMQITVRSCNNNPPFIEANDKICVLAGEKITEVLVANDIDDDQLVRFTATGGPFLNTFGKASFQVADAYNPPPVSAIFEWQTNCNHISEVAYNAIFKAEDDFFTNIFGEKSGLVDLKNMEIIISGPPPIDLIAKSNGNEIDLSWESPYICDTAIDDFFRGFTVWRKQAASNIELDTCGMDMRDLGFEAIAFNQKTINNNRYFYSDGLVEKGITYCYRVTAEFGQRSPGGNIYNRSESLPSNEQCLQLLRDIPLITNVSVITTDLINGEIEIRWVAPLATDLDTIENPPPYALNLLRAEDISGQNFIAVNGANFIANSFFELTRINNFFDGNLNTASKAYNYKLDFFTNLNAFKGASQAASSVYLNSTPSDRKNKLTWSFDVPWNNYESIIYRLNNVTNNFDSIATSNTNNYEDLDLINGVKYCYLIKTKGTYGITDIPSPLENYSQESCGMPIDTIPPCAPIIYGTSNCDRDEPQSLTELIVDLSFNFADNNCSDSIDVTEIKIYYVSFNGNDTLLILDSDDPTIRTFNYVIPDQIGGCFFIQTIDESNNQSTYSNIYCVSLCPTYLLPNTFTPNGDGSNDLFIPYPYKFVSKVNFSVYTRWNNLVFETTDPDINWNGTDTDGNDLQEDTYFYVCHVFTTNEFGILIKDKTLKGHISLIRD